MQIDENNDDLIDEVFDQEYNYLDEDFNDNEEDEDLEETVDNNPDDDEDNGLQKLFLNF